VECVTLAQYRKLKGGDADITGKSKYPLAIPKIRTKVLGGWCGALVVAEGDISECLKVADEYGEIGDCSHCGHYWPDEPGLRMEVFNETKGKEKVNADTKYLIRMIELVRRGLGYEEDIRLRAASFAAQQ
jgi:hypothetical protein